ncbi:IS3 family transposase [Acinetobacter sp. WCHAc060033]|uniref:IS3 family transposase n=1 Tax=Acinetobacter sp. WCHAc060033 TaxID=2518624 RepID=UPI001023296F|nr:IS3 family transposase [Acinetobacter sp. WCHAc060033]RZG77046.1 IS3 family transposase [Acinetobacter sp. WCHAc060033]
MAKRFSPEFKQQAIDYALSNSHESVAAIAQKLGVGYSTLDKWIRETNPTGSSKRQLSPEQQRILDLEKEVKQLREANDNLKKGACVLPDRSCQEKYTVIQGLAVTETTVSSACKCLGVSTSGYYAWRKRQIYVNQKYTDLKAVYWQHHARLGAPSLVHDMHDLGYCMSERTVGRMLKKLSLRSKIARKYKHTTDSNHRLPTAPNLLDRQFTVTLPNKVWTTDITYIRTKEGWLYLCVMLDLFSRRIIGWQTSYRIDRQLVCDAFNYAMARQGYSTSVMVHSDQGSQYCSRDFRALLLANNCIQSMSRRGNCWDNAVTESFFHTLKGHVIHDSVFATRKEANAVLFEYIEVYYNRIRRHSANGWLSPEAFEHKYFKNLEGYVVHDIV